MLGKCVGGKMKTKKIILFIPLLNFILLFLWMMVYPKTHKKNKQFSSTFFQRKFFQGLICIFGIAFCVTIPIAVLVYVNVSELAFQIIGYINVYFLGFFLGLFCIKNEINLLKEIERRLEIIKNQSNTEVN